MSTFGNVLVAAFSWAVLIWSFRENKLLLQGFGSSMHQSQSRYLLSFLFFFSFCAQAKVQSNFPIHIQDRINTHEHNCNSNDCCHCSNHNAVPSKFFNRHIDNT